MTTAANLMGVGMPAQQALAVAGATSPALAITAAGAVQATATLLTTDFNVVTTAAAGTGVILPAIANFGDEVQVANYGASALTIYPPLGGKINNGATNAGITVATLKAAQIRSLSSLNWFAIVGA